MIKHVYASKNKLSGNFNLPVLHDFTCDNAVEQFTISALENPSEQIKELEMYFLGTFDTKTGVYDQTGMCFLVDLGSVLNERKSKES